ncbi:hypothetical protein KCU95_g3148, partial [Aureobasidium melanogenum]
MHSPSGTLINLLVAGNLHYSSRPKVSVDGSLEKEIHARRAQASTTPSKSAVKKASPANKAGIKPKVNKKPKVVEFVEDEDEEVEDG